MSNNIAIYAKLCVQIVANAAHFTQYSGNHPYPIINKGSIIKLSNTVPNTINIGRFTSHNPLNNH